MRVVPRRIRPRSWRPCKTRFRHRIGGDRDLRAQAFVDHAIGVLLVGGGQRAHMASAYTADVSAAQCLVGDHFQGAHAAIVCLVDMHVEVAAEALGETET